MSTNPVNHNYSNAPLTFAQRAANVTQYGISVMPILPRSKDPFLPDWTNLATTEETQITRWAKQYPTHNCAAVAFNGRYWFFEIDEPSLPEKIKTDTGHSLDELDTLVVKSSGAKRHYYFKHDFRSEAMGNVSADDAKDGEIFSVRAHHEYVVCPGSIHPDTGLPYEIVREPSFCEIPTAPPWLIDWINSYPKLSKSSGHAKKIPEIIPDGSRNKTLASLAGSMRNRGADESTILAALQTMNLKQCHSPLEDSEVEAIAKSISRYPTQAAFVQNPTQKVQSLVVRPTLSETAYYGLAGAMTKKLEPQTEAHPAGLLLELLISFGSVIGRCAYIQIDNTRHYTNEFVVKVGESSRSRKGTGRNRIRAFMSLIDPDWASRRNVSGIGSGEVIIFQIRDERTAWVVDKKTGVGRRTVIDDGVKDKRLLVNIGEFQGILTVCHRPDNLLSVVLRDGWDGVVLDNLVKTDPSRCQFPHLSFDADTTKSDLSLSLSQADRNNGFANRFLWVYVYRTKLLAMGGDDMDWTAEVAQFQKAVEFARRTGRVFLDEPARKMWTRTMYPKLEEDIPGLVGAITARASAHTLRIALLFALLDLSDHVRVEHLEAAGAVWQYCEDSARAIFDNLLSPEQQQILDFLATVGTATKTQILHDCFKRNRRAELVQNDLDVLISLGKIAAKTVDGTPWYSVLGRANSGEKVGS